jgi:hypothetical protein
MCLRNIKLIRVTEENFRKFSSWNKQVSVNYITLHHSFENTQGLRNKRNFNAKKRIKVIKDLLKYLYFEFVDDIKSWLPQYFTIICSQNVPEYTKPIPSWIIFKNSDSNDLIYEELIAGSYKKTQIL